MTEEQISSIREEMNYCRRNMVALGNELHKLHKAREQLLEVYFSWKDRFVKLDTKLAMETKLVVLGRGRRSETVDSIETVLKDPDKAKKLIELLRDEIGNGAEQMAPNVPLTNV